MDSLTGIVFDDDSQIKLATVEIMQPDKDPRIEIHIEEIQMTLNILIDINIKINILLMA